jgi:dTDP-4-dehydrorhamnose 3,5-epimerase
MEVHTTSLPGVLLIRPDIHNRDLRGNNATIYNLNDYRANGIPIDFVEDKISASHGDVLRGIHCDLTTWKLVSCLYGLIYFVVVNCDDLSPEFGRWQGFTLDDENLEQVLVPPEYGNAHLVLSARAVFHYKWSDYYHPERQIHYAWDDSRFNIPWPTRHPILSERDKQPSDR